jgi:hypothetical protein
MTSFIELPRLTFHGQPKQSIYVNVADIVVIEPSFDGQTNVAVRDLGSQGLGIVQTYVPLEPLLDTLGEMARHPGTRSWTDSVKTAWAAPIATSLAEAYARERVA